MRVNIRLNLENNNSSASCHALNKKFHKKKYKYMCTYIHIHLFIYNFKTYSLKDIKESIRKSTIPHLPFHIPPLLPKLLSLKTKKKKMEIQNFIQYLQENLSEKHEF